MNLRCYCDIQGEQFSRWLLMVRISNNCCTLGPFHGNALTCLLNSNNVNLLLEFNKVTLEKFIEPEDLLTQ